MISKWPNSKQTDDRLSILWKAKHKKHKILMARIFKRGSWIKNTSTYSHNLAPLLHVLPHGVDNVTAHVLPSSAFLPHPDQTHPVRTKESRTLTQDCVTLCSVRICVTSKLKRSARQHTQHLWPAADYHRNSFLQTFSMAQILSHGLTLFCPHFNICKLLLYEYCRW